jgi:hypothetical protein
MKPLGFRAPVHKGFENKHMVVGAFPNPKPCLACGPVPLILSPGIKTLVQHQAE